MAGKLGPDAMSSRRMYEVLDLCLSCKSCKSECPSNVDMAKFKSEFLQHYHDEHGVSLRDRMIAGMPRLARTFAGPFAGIVNFIQSAWLTRLLLQLIARFDRRRRLPAYSRQPFSKWFIAHTPKKRTGEKRVVLFDDCYLNYTETSIGIAAVELLESCGYEVIAANAGCCQRPSITHGLLRSVKEKGEQTLRNLDRFIEQGLTIVVCEPSCYSALTDDLPDLIEDEGLAKRIRDNVMMIDHFVEEEIEAGHIDCELTSSHEKILVHGHCHQKALSGTQGMVQVLARVENLSVSEIDSGCCGMAGSFGLEAEHYDLSMKVGEERLFPAIRDQRGSATIVACGTSCRQQIADGTGVRPLHWVETLRGKAKGE